MAIHGKAEGPASTISGKFSGILRSMLHGLSAAFVVHSRWILASSFSLFTQPRGNKRFRLYCAIKTSFSYGFGLTGRAVEICLSESEISPENFLT